MWCYTYSFQYVMSEFEEFLSVCWGVGVDVCSCLGWVCGGGCLCMCGGGCKDCVYVCLLVACGFQDAGYFLLILYVVFRLVWICVYECLWYALGLVIFIFIKLSCIVFCIITTTCFIIFDILCIYIYVLHYLSLVCIWIVLL